MPMAPDADAGSDADAGPHAGSGSDGDAGTDAGAGSDAALLIYTDEFTVIYW